MTYYLSAATSKFGLRVTPGHSKMVPFESSATVSYSHFIAIIATSLAVCEMFSVNKWPDLENWVGAVQSH